MIGNCVYNLHTYYTDKPFSVLYNGEEWIGILEGIKKSPRQGKKMIKNWDTLGTLTVLCTEKCIGSSVMFTLVKGSHNCDLIIGGTRDLHIVTSVSDVIELHPSDFLYEYRNNSNYNTLKTLFSDIKCILSSTSTLLKGDCVVGKEKDGEITWIGIFNDQETTFEKIEMIQKLGLKTIRYTKIPGTLDQVFYNLKLMPLNNMMVYYTNGEKTFLYQDTPSIFILGEFILKVFKKGVDNLHLLQELFIRKQRQHGLNTTSSIRITKKIYYFFFWMIENYSYIKNKYPNSTIHSFWDIFKKMTRMDIKITFEDLGKFDANTYQHSTKLYSTRQITSPTILFVQGKENHNVEHNVQHNVEHNVQNNVQNNVRVKVINSKEYLKGSLYHYIASNIYDTIIIHKCVLTESEYKSCIENCLTLKIDPIQENSKILINKDNENIHREMKSDTDVSKQVQQKHVSLYLDNIDKEILKSFVKLNLVKNDLKDYNVYCDRNTQFNIIESFNLYQKVQIDIDYAIMRLSDSCIVFNVCNIGGKSTFTESKIDFISGILLNGMTCLESLGILLDYKKNQDLEKYKRLDCNFSFFTTCL